MNTKPFIVGITGGSASGKTSFLNELMSAFPKEQICLISQDNYYRDLASIAVDNQGVHNFDLPETIDHLRYAQHIQELREGGIVEQLEYTFNNPNIIPQIMTFRPAPIIVVEGIFVFYFREIADLLDLKIFIDAKNSIKLERRLKRDAEERGYDLDDVMYRWKYHVQPTYKQFIKPYRAEADIVIPNNVHYRKGLNVVISYLKTKISNSMSTAQILPAVEEDIARLNQLVNSAYRGDFSRRGWTTEADLLDGIRTSEPLLLEMIRNPKITILKYVQDGELLGCVCLENKDNSLYLGMLTVSPDNQVKGIGKQLLQAAEEYAHNNHCQKITMTVLPMRHELVAFYERRGFRPTGETHPFPADDPNFGLPKQPLAFIVMEKAIH